MDWKLLVNSLRRKDKHGTDEQKKEPQRLLNVPKLSAILTESYLQLQQEGLPTRLKFFH